jgi:hypothetical protein
MKQTKRWLIAASMRTISVLVFALLLFSTNLLNKPMAAAGIAPLNVYLPLINRGPELDLSTSATTITSTIPNPSTPGQVVVVSVTVSGAGLPVPTGTVDITGADTNCSLLLAGGSGSCGVIFNTTGHKTLTATYSGDWFYLFSWGTADHIVTKGSTTVNITADTPDPSVPGQAVEVSFSVIGGGVAPTGFVSITGADIGCVIALSGGSGSCNVVFITIGDKTLTATYLGDSNYLSSVGTELHSVKNASITKITSVILTVSYPGDTVLVSFTVSGPGAIPTGLVQISGADSTCSAGLDGAGKGSCTVLFNTAGSKILTASYAGDANYVGGVGTYSHIVNKGISTTAIGPVVPPSGAAPYALVAVGVGVSGAGVMPTGSVGISLSGTPAQLVSCTIQLDSMGVGTCNIYFTATGAFTINAQYSGDGNYLASSQTYIYTVGP